MADPEITAEDEAKFAGLDAETLAELEKFKVWETKKKALLAEKGNLSNNSPGKGNGRASSLTLDDLEELVSTPGKRSILASLMAQAEALPKLPAKGGKEAAKGIRKGLANLL